MAGYLDWVECNNCGYNSACLDVNTKTGDTYFYCKICKREIINGTIKNKGEKIKC
jgi:hypothetical protein